jgi:hypothetical protein
LLYIRIITLRLLAIIPVVRFLSSWRWSVLRCRLDIHIWSLLLDDDRRSIVVAIIPVGIMWSG